MVPLNLPKLEVYCHGRDHKGDYLVTELVPGERPTLYHRGLLWGRTGTWDLVDGPIAVYRPLDPSLN